MDISEKLRRLRAEHDLTQAQLAKIAGVSDKAISAWESGTRSPKIGAIHNICRYFCLDINYFIDETAPAATHTPQAQAFDDFTYAMYNEAKTLPQEKKDMLLQMARFFNEELRKEQ